MVRAPRLPPTTSTRSRFVARSRASRAAHARGHSACSRGVRFTSLTRGRIHERSLRARARGLRGLRLSSRRMLRSHRARGRRLRNERREPVCRGTFPVLSDARRPDGVRWLRRASAVRRAFLGQRRAGRQRQRRERRDGRRALRSRRTVPRHLVVHEQLLRPELLLGLVLLPRRLQRLVASRLLAHLLEMNAL